MLADSTMNRTVRRVLDRILLAASQHATTAS
jgi:hypothetical protein